MVHPRVLRDLARLAEDAVEGIMLLSCEDMGNIEVLISGPEDSDYSGGLFQVAITLPLDSYPFEAPMVNFKTPIFHPNISRLDGEVCVDILKNKWAPTITLKDICEAMRGLMRDMNDESPLNGHAAHMHMNHREMFKKTVLVWIHTLARGSIQADPEYLEKLDIVSAIAPSKERALEVLTARNWDVLKSCGTFT